MESLLINYLTVSQSAQKGASDMLTKKEAVSPVVIEAINPEEKKEKGMLKMENIREKLERELEEELRSEMEALGYFEEPEEERKGSAETPFFVKKGRNKMKKLMDQIKALKILWAAARFEKKKEKGEKFEKIDLKKFKQELILFDEVERDDLAMVLSGGLVAMVATNHHFFTGKATHILYYDGWFLKMSEGTQKFILAHELGHVIKGHTDGSRDNMGERLEFLKEGTAVQPIELEADAFAADEVGVETAISALKEIKKLVGTSEASAEIDLRISALEENKENYLFVESLLKGGE